MDNQTNPADDLFFAIQGQYKASVPVIVVFRAGEIPPMHYLAEAYMSHPEIVLQLIAGWIDDIADWRILHRLSISISFSSEIGFASQMAMN